MNLKNNKKAVIFLDNDGVICLDNNWGGRSKKWSKYLKKNPECMSEADAPVEVRFDNFDGKAISVLNKILEETGAEIVVSSDWKKDATLEELGEYYINHQIIKKPIGMTKLIEEVDDAPNLYVERYEEERAREIGQYLKDHPEITHWVAVDDLNLAKDSGIPDAQQWGLENFVRCIGFNQGIKRSGLKEKIIKFLE